MVADTDMTTPLAYEALNPGKDRANGFWMLAVGPAPFVCDAFSSLLTPDDRFDIRLDWYIGRSPWTAWVSASTPLD